MRNRFDLKTRKALVTGASMSIGRAIALGLAENGADVGIHYAAKVDQELGQPDAAEQVAREARNLGVDAVTVEGDLALAGAGKRVIGQAIETMGRIDILVVCASIQYNVPFLETTDEQFERQVAINFKSSYDMLQAALPPMGERGWGRVLTVGSINQYQPRPILATYAALKSAQFNLSQNLAAQYAHRGVSVNNIAPGLIQTERNRWRRDNMADWNKTAAACCPMGRAGQPEDMVGAALLLCSDAGAYITGAELLITGGMHLAWGINA